MSESALWDVEQATIGWQQAMQNAQNISAATLDQAATYLLTIYQKAQDALSKIMADEPPSSGKGYDSKKWPSQISAWQAQYNEASSEWSNLETQWDTVTKNVGQVEQQDSNGVQQASQISAVIVQPGTKTGELLSSSY